MQIRKATKDDCLDIAKLALMAGEGIPRYFWAKDAAKGKTALQVGAERAASERENFSYRNTHIAVIGDEIAGMMLAYPLPEAEQAEGLDDFPAFIRPLIELEQLVPGSFYINMLATYPQYRGRSVGTRLMGIVDTLASQQGCALSSIQVFEQNRGARRLYLRQGYQVLAQRPVVPHPCHPYSGQVVLLTRPVHPCSG